MRNQFVVLFLSRAVASVSQAVCMILLARWTGPMTFGYVSVAIGAGVVLIAISDLGVGTYVLRARSVVELQSTIASALRLNRFTSIAVVIISSSAIFIAAQFNSIFYAVLPISLWLAAEKNADIWLNLSISDSRAGHAALAIVVRRFSALAFMLMFHLFDIEPVLSFSVALAAGSILGLIVSRLLVEVGPSVPMAVRVLLVRTWPYWVTNLTSQLRNLDVIITGLFTSAATAGFYASAVRLTNPVLLFTGSLTSVLLPSVSRASLNTVRFYNKRLVVTVVVLVPLFLLLGGPMAQVGILLLGENYENARSSIRAMLVAMVFIGVCPASASILQGLDDAKFSAKNGLFFVPVFFASVSVGSSLGGAFGASIGIGVAFLLKFLSLEFRTISVLARRSREGSVSGLPASETAFNADAVGGKCK